MKKYTILIPIYNDRESLTKLIENINFEAKDLASQISIIVINDASSQQVTDDYSNTENINTIEIINRVQNYRKSNHIPICFTLDAGANLHLLFPDSCSEKAYKFIDSELKYLCENNSYIKDTVGFGAKQL